MNYEYEGYREALPTHEIVQQHNFAEAAEREYRKTKEELALILASRGIADYIAPEVTEV